jgi:amphi-Trp domain-containing protein
MAEKTLDEQRLSRSDVAERLRTLADELDDENGEGDEINVPVGNKRVRLSPPETIGYEIGVREGSSVLRGDRETVTVKLDWRPE